MLWSLSALRRECDLGVGAASGSIGPSGTGVCLPSGHTDPTGCRVARDDVDVALNGALRMGRKFPILSDVPIEVSSADELLDLPLQLAALLSVVPALPVER